MVDWWPWGLGMEGREVSVNELRWLVKVLVREIGSNLTGVDSDEETKDHARVCYS